MKCERSAEEKCEQSAEEKCTKTIRMGMRMCINYYVVKVFIKLVRSFTNEEEE